MTLFCELSGLLLITFGIVCLAWAALGRLLLPGKCPVRAVVEAKDAGEGLEQTVKGLLWLRSAGLWRGVVVIEDCGLDQQGIVLARTLARQDGVEIQYISHRNEDLPWN